MTSLHRRPFLQPLTAIDFTGIEIAAGIELGDMHEMKFAGVAAGAAEGARAAGCHWLHVDFEPELRVFYVDACGFASTAAGLVDLTAAR